MALKTVGILHRFTHAKFAERDALRRIRGKCKGQILAPKAMTIKKKSNPLLKRWCKC
jgi:hypothetical protein